METAPQTQFLTQLVFYSTSDRITASWIFDEAGKNLWWKTYLTVQVNRNVLFIFFMAETQRTTLGRLLRGLKKNISGLHCLKNTDSIYNSTKPFAVAATN